jgi:Cu-Zn family superoxide dismutase
MNLKPFAVIGLFSLAACSSLPHFGSTDGPTAVVSLKPTAGFIATGKVNFSQDGNKVRVQGTITGMSPGPHGFHIHEKGDCSAPDATSAGGHFNPDGKKHGSDKESDHHAGDFGNLKADDYGTASFDFEAGGLTTVPGKPNSVVGRALIVHSDADDLKTQPTGNSGKRIACGVIQEGPKQK